MAVSIMSDILVNRNDGKKCVAFPGLRESTDLTENSSVGFAQSNLPFSFITWVSCLVPFCLVHL